MGNGNGNAFLNTGVTAEHLHQMHEKLAKLQSTGKGSRAHYEKKKSKKAQLHESG